MAESVVSLSQGAKCEGHLQIKSYLLGTFGSKVTEYIKAKKWTDMHCVLNEGFMYLFKNQASSKYSEKIDVRNQFRTLNTNLDSKPDERGKRFDLSDGKQSHSFLAYNTYDLEKWTKAIREEHITAASSTNEASNTYTYQENNEREGTVQPSAPDFYRNEQRDNNFIQHQIPQQVLQFQKQLPTSNHIPELYNQPQSSYNQPPYNQPPYNQPPNNQPPNNQSPFNQRQFNQQSYNQESVDLYNKPQPGAPNRWENAQQQPLPPQPRQQTADFYNKTNHDSFQEQDTYVDTSEDTNESSCDWNDIFWVRSEDATTYLWQMNEDGAYLIRSKTDDRNNKVLVVFLLDQPKGNVFKYNIRTKMAADGPKYYLVDESISFTELKDLCSHYMYADLPKYQRRMEPPRLKKPLVSIMKERGIY